MYIQRDADRLHRIATGFKYGYADVDTIAERSNNSTAEFMDVHPEDTLMIHFEHFNNNLQFIFMRPKKEKNVKVYELLPTKDWQTEANYRTYKGPLYLLTNYKQLHKVY